MRRRSKASFATENRRSPKKFDCRKKDQSLDIYASYYHPDSGQTTLFPCLSIFPLANAPRLALLICATLAWRSASCALLVARHKNDQRYHALLVPRQCCSRGAETTSIHRRYQVFLGVFDEANCRDRKDY